MRVQKFCTLAYLLINSEPNQEFCSLPSDQLWPKWEDINNQINEGAKMLQPTLLKNSEQSEKYHKTQAFCLVITLA